MSHYRRNRVEGGYYFFTVNARHRSSRLLVDQIDPLRRAVAITRASLPFHIDAWVVLPDHMHCIWTLPPGDDRFPKRWQNIKRLFSRAVAVGEPRNQVMRNRGERGLWQKRYWEHTILDDQDYAMHMDYVHFNLVKHGLVENAGDWPFSSFHRAVARGIYPAAWGGDGGSEGEFGEAG